MQQNVRRHLMFDNKKQRPGVQTFFGVNGGSATVFNSGSDMFTVTGSNGHDDTFHASSY